MKNVLFISLLFFFAGCNPAKKVMQNQKQFEKIGEAWAQKNPCVNDTTIVFRPGRVDTLTLTAPAFDVNRAADSIAQALANKYNQKLEECNRQVNEAYNAGYMKSSAYWSKIKIPIPAPDTVNNYIRDMRAERILANQIGELQNDVLERSEEAQFYKGQRNRAYGVILLFLMSGITIGYFKWIK